MTTTDRRDATDAQFADELARLNRLDVADEDTVERVARELCDTDAADSGYRWGELESMPIIRDAYRKLARAAIDALKPAPGTDTSGQAVHGDHGPARCVSVDEANRVLAETRGSTEDALHRVLDLADEYEAAGHLPNLSEFDRGVGAHQRDAAARIRGAVAGPQRDGEGDDQPRRCIHCGALCDHRVQACECGPDCPLPKVAR